MLMKKIHYFALSLAVGILVCGCSDENELSTQNRGKEKPVVTLTADEVDGGSFTFTIAASEQASQYAYAILEGTDNPTPLAYDIVCDEVGNVAEEDRENGNYSHYAFNVSEKASATHTFECKPQGKYEVFAAAITSTGLLGEVAKLSITIPKIELQAGNYTVSYTDAGGDPYEFSAKIVSDEEDQTKCLLYADWFGAFGGYADPVLVGKVDVISKQVVFDGTFLEEDGSLAKNDDGSLASAFGMPFYRIDLGLGFDCLLAFFGGGDTGKEPIVASMDNKGYLTDISYFTYIVYNADTRKQVGTFDSCNDGRMIYVPEGGDTPETQAHAAVKKNVAGMEKLETPRYGFCK